MQYSYEDVTIRDLKKEDEEQFIKWYTEMSEWKKWVSPWGGLFRSERALKRLFKNYDPEKLPSTRHDFQIEKDGRHVGWIYSHYLDGDQDKLSVNIIIPDPKDWNSGIGEKGLVCFLRYVFEKDPYINVYIEVWDENKRMLRLAEKLGFNMSPLETTKIKSSGKEYTIIRLQLTFENVERYRI